MDDEATEEEEDEGRCEGRETTVTKGRHTVGGNNNNDNYAPPPLPFLLLLFFYLPPLHLLLPCLPHNIPGTILPPPRPPRLRRQRH